jgi:predicted SprT family Zn-dependent metalloprotease
VILDSVTSELEMLIELYVRQLELPSDCLRLTTHQSTFERWLGRRLGSSVGGAYAFLSRTGEHAVLVNLSRIDLSQTKALEIVVAEELIHMRDRLDGDLRRHAKHGYDRIARRVAELTDVTPEEIRSCLIPTQRRPFRYLYECPKCGGKVGRRRTGVWSCARCSPTFDRRFVLRLTHRLSRPSGEPRECCAHGPNSEFG